MTAPPSQGDPVARRATRMLVAETPQQVEARFVAAGAQVHPPSVSKRLLSAAGIQIIREPQGWTVWANPSSVEAVAKQKLAERVFVRCTPEEQGTRLVVTPYDNLRLHLASAILFFAVCWSTSILAGDALSTYAWVWLVLMVGACIVIPIQRSMAQLGNNAALQFLGEVLTPLALSEGATRDPFRKRSLRAGDQTGELDDPGEPGAADDE